MTQKSDNGIHRVREKGVTAIFIVLFSSLLFSLIAVSFTALMLSEQGRSIDDEQSQGAYDAALVGVEDGKRVLEACLNAGPTPTVEEQRACDAIDNGQCNTINHASNNIGSFAEVGVRTDSLGSGESLNMAYTCVIINPSTPNVLETLAAHDSSAIFALRPNPGESFDSVKISWFTQQDSATIGGLGAAYPLEQLGSWAPTKPPVLRAQLIQYREGDFDTAGTFDEGEYASTHFLYPVSGPAPVVNGEEIRRSGNIDVARVECNALFPVSGYACEVTIDMPPVPDGGSPTDRVAYLRLTSLYRGANVEVQMLDGANVVDFDGVQPSIDSTGRANDLFRRVESRVEFTSGDFQFPRATVDITRDLCKVFTLTDQTSDFTANTSICDPLAT